MNVPRLMPFLFGTDATASRRRFAACASAVSLLSATAGCASSLSELGPKFSGKAQRSVYVRPINLNVSRVDREMATGEELTDLLVEKLHQRGIDASKNPHELNATDTLYCGVPSLGYTVAQGYPRRLQYQANLACSLVDRTSQAVDWQRHLEQRYDESIVFNTMTKLPESHEPILWRECVMPLWDAMAVSLRLYLDRPPMPRTHVQVGAPEETDAAPAVEAEYHK